MTTTETSTQLSTESPQTGPTLRASSERPRSTWNLVLWNLDHARSKTHDPARSAAISQSDPDIVVLTETHDRIRPDGQGWSPVHSKPRPPSTAATSNGRRTIKPVQSPSFSN